MVDLPVNFSKSFFDWAFNYNSYYRKRNVIGRFVIDHHGLTNYEEKEFEEKEYDIRNKAIRKNEFYLDNM